MDSALSDLLYRENVALANGVLRICVALVCALAFIRMARRSSFREARNDQVGQFIFVMFTINIGESVYRLWVWMILKRFNHSLPTAWVKAQWPIVAIASAVIAIGLLCLIRITVPVEWRRRALIIAAGLTSVAVTLNSLF